MKRTTTSLTLLALPGFAMADVGTGYGDGYYHSMMWGSSYGFMGFGAMVIFWFAVIVLIYLAARWLSDRSQSSSKLDPMDILRERLARGDIDAEDFEARKKVLKD